MNPSRRILKSPDSHSTIDRLKTENAKNASPPKTVDPSHHGSTIRDMRLPGVLTCDTVEPGGAV